MHHTIKTATIIAVMSSEFPPYVQAMLRPSIYPDRPVSVELVQTQMSYIFLTGTYAYKARKPVNLGYLDYSTLKKREYFSRQELDLNRRLSPGAYLEVLPVTQSPGGFELGGKGEVIEYAVKMRQLPRDRMMDVLLPDNRVTTAMLDKLAALMADFHGRAATGPDIKLFGSPDGVRVNTDENFNQTEKYVGSLISEKGYLQLKEYTSIFFRDNEALLDGRVGQGRIRDCHGDLHCAHVCLADEISIFDCIEFNERFRYCDTASEIAFLAMDMDRYGRADLSTYFVQAYIKAAKDPGLTDLLDFYKCYRAYVRGKVACFKHDDPLLKEKDAIKKEAGLYFNLACRYAGRRPFLIIVTGLIGTGKSTAAGRISRALDCPVLSSDIIRKELAGVPSTERHYEGYSDGIYGPESTQSTYDEMFKRADLMLKKGQSVILDASFRKRADRQTALKLAEESGAGFLAVECTASEDDIRRRLERRRQGSSVSDGRWEIFSDIKRDFEKVDEIPGNCHIVINTSAGPVNITALILERMAII